MNIQNYLYRWIFLKIALNGFHTVIICSVIAFIVLCGIVYSLYATLVERFRYRRTNSTYIFVIIICSWIVAFIIISCIVFKIAFACVRMYYQNLWLVAFFNSKAKLSAQFLAYVYIRRGIILNIKIIILLPCTRYICFIDSIFILAFVNFVIFSKLFLSGL